MDSLSPLALRKMDRVAASRQKSCNACVRGKRKCDKKTPRCTRCAAKSLDCVYQKIPPGASFHDEDLGVGSATTAAQTSSSARDEVPEFDMGFVDLDSLNHGTSSSGNSNCNTATTSPESLQTSVSSIQIDPSLDFSLIDQLMANEASAGAELWNFSNNNDLGSSSSSSSNKMEIPPVPSMPVNNTSNSSHLPVALRDPSLLGDPDCMQFNPLDVHDTRTRVGYVVDVVANMYRDFASRRALPFVHPRLYGSSLPRTMMSAFSASAAYAARTPENRAWVYKLVTDVARDIHREGEHANTPAERLARVQALVILDSIRVFDGDLGLRAAAERETPQFLAWVNNLGALREELEEGVNPEMLMCRDRPPASWESWILLESVRRTMMMAISFLCLSCILKSIEPPCEMDPHSFTASRHLWEASSSVCFFQAWHQKPQFCVSNMDFKNVWMYARPEDLDEFTRMMLTAQAGTDAMDYFMQGTGNVPISV